METNIQFIIGITLLLIGFSMVIRAEDWITWTQCIQKKGRIGSLGIGIINTFIGAFILGFHWLGQGFAAMIIFTIGIIALFKGFLYLMVPSWLPGKLAVLAPAMKGAIYLSGSIMILASAYVLYDWYITIGALEGWLLENNMAVNSGLTN